MITKDKKESLIKELKSTAYFIFKSISTQIVPVMLLVPLLLLMSFAPENPSDLYVNMVSITFIVTFFSAWITVRYIVISAWESIDKSKEKGLQYLEWHWAEGHISVAKRETKDTLNYIINYAPDIIKYLKTIKEKLESRKA